MREYQGNIEFLFNKYLHRVYAVAKKAQRRHIIPWLKENDYTMLCGNGEWFILKDGDFVDGATFPTNIYDILTTPVAGLPQNDLGSCMDSWPPVLLTGPDYTVFDDSTNIPLLGEDK